LGFGTWILKNLVFGKTPWVLRIKEKRKLIDTGFGISLGIGRCWFLWDIGQIDLINQLLM
jgi:hypothetical protein